LLADPLRKITTDPHIVAHGSMDCPPDWYPVLKTGISELILDSHKYILIAYVTIHCMI